MAEIGPDRNLDIFSEHIPHNQRASYLRDQKKAALLATEIVKDKDELLDVLEMLGLKVIRPQ